MERFLLNLTRSQAKTIELALDLYFRVGMGQLDALKECFQQSPLDSMSSKKNLYDKVDDLERTLCKVLTGRESGYLSIHSDSLSIPFKRAYDIHLVIRNMLLKDKPPPFGFQPVGLDDPSIRRSLLDEDLPSFTII